MGKYIHLHRTKRVKTKLVNNYKTAYLHGRPGPHPMHGKFAESVGAKFHFIDPIFRWQDRNRPVLYRLMSWIACSLFFPSRKEYSIFLVDNLHFQPVIMKMFRLIRKDQKIVAYMGSHTLYFLYAHRFSKFNEWLHIKALGKYDAIICEGKMAAELTVKILGTQTPPLYVVSNGIPAEHFHPEKYRQPIPTNRNMLFIGHISSDFRTWYKGVDLMIGAFCRAKKELTDLEFTVVGSYDQTTKDSLTKNTGASGCTVRFPGPTNDLSPFLQGSSLYLHCARGEAFGITILIALSAGIIPIVSEWTGAREIVELVDKRLIVPLDEQAISKKIIWYYQLPSSERESLSKKCRDIARGYTEENAIAGFKQVFEKMAVNFGLVK